MGLAFPKPESRAREKQQRKRTKEAIRRDVYREVTIRDGRRCRSCGSRVHLHHHHLRFRSKGGADTSANLLLLCAVCHDDLHGYRLGITGTDANKVLRFVRRG